MPEKPKVRGEIIINENGELEVTGGDPPPPEEEIRAARKNSAQCGHVKRRLNENKPLSGKTLEFALEVAGKDSDIGKKLSAGEPLTDYEHHIMVDVYLLHTKLGAI